MRAFVTGAAGFIGSHLVDRLLAEGGEVVGFDSLITGQKRFLEGALSSPGFRLIEADLGDAEALRAGSRGCDIVFHLAANADVRHGLEHPDRDLRVNTLGTFQVLEAMRANGIRDIAFSSTGSVYGEARVFPTPEDAPFPVQTSLYAASKLAGESLIQAYCEGYGMRGFIFRFVSILGERYSHGHVFDFFQRLREDPSRLDVLGDGRQKKSYLYVGDCVDAILTAVAHGCEKSEVYNLGTDEWCEVLDSVGWITGRLGLSPEIRTTGGARGWVGDNPLILLDCRKIRALGWKPKLTIREGIERTVDYLAANPWLLEARP